MKFMANPPVIPKNEILERWRRVKLGLEKNDFDALLVPLGIYFNYLFGKQGQPSERLIAGIISKSGDPFIVAPSFEETNIQISTGVDDIAIWSETESPYELVAHEFKERKIEGNIAIDPKLWAIEREKLITSTNYNFSSAHKMLEEIRSKKSVWEIEQLQKAAQASSEGILNAIPQLTLGISEKKFLRVVHKEMTELSGSPLAFGLVQFGENSAIPHGMPSEKKLKNDEVVLIDCGTPVNGYQGDITITIPFGKPNGFEEIYEIVYDANRKAFDFDKPGIIPAELDKVARDHIESKGYGKYFTHRLGHGIGLEVHETPYIVGNNTVPLVEGNCHTIEPGIYIPGKYGIRVEDDVFLTSSSAQRLFDTPRHNF
jgi:Xaa-Pro dipeptidase